MSSTFSSQDDDIDNKKTRLQPVIESSLPPVATALPSAFALSLLEPVLRLYGQMGGK